MKEQKHSYSQRIGKTTFIVNVKQSESAKKPLNTVFQDICKHEVLGGFFTDKSFNLENPQKYLDKLNPEGLSGAILHSLRNSPPDCFSQMLTHLEPRVSCTACNSLIAPYNFLQIHAYSYFPRRAAKANLDRYTPAAARVNTASGAMDENAHQQEVPPSGECSVCQPCCKW